MESDEEFCLKWNDFQGSISSSLGSLRTTSDLLDVTLQCGKESLQCHRLVLSACSDWFKAVFRALPAVTQHPVIVLWETAASEMALLLDFMYNGEVNVMKENLHSFLALAEKLSVQGLTQGQDGGGEKEKDQLTEPVGQAPPSQTSTPMVKRQDDRGKTAKRRREEHREPEQRDVQQHHEVEEEIVVKEEVTREVEQVEYVVEENGNYQEGGEVAQYEGDNMYDSNYEGDDGGQADYSQTDNSLMENSQMDNSQQMASKGSFKNGPGICPFCNKTVQKLGYHVEDKHVPNPTPCTECGKVFSSVNKMRAHRSSSHRQKKDLKVEPFF